MFSDTIALALKAAADKEGIETACLLALVEVETAGAPFEQDGRTPQLLYERHHAWQEAIKAGCLPAFKSAGLAIPHWDRATQYRDQRTSAQRLELIARARAINEEVADRSASWGLGQTMGFLAEELGFPSAAAMVAHQTGSIDGQIDCLIRELRHSHLIEPLNSHDWAHVARIYNGSGYAANQYDTRLADAWKRWTRKVAAIVPAPEDSLTREQISAIQSELRQLGYHEVGIPDGLWGSRTTGAISAFQAHEGLPVTGHYDDVTAEALTAALPRPVPTERAEAQPDDLPSSRTLAHAKKLSLGGQVIQWLGLGGAASAGADKTGLLDQASGAMDRFGQLRSLYDGLADGLSWASVHWWLFALIGGVAIAYWAERVIAARLADHRSGVHAGPSGD